MGIIKVFRNKILSKGHCPFCLAKLSFTANDQKIFSENLPQEIPITCVCKRKYSFNTETQKITITSN